MAKETEPIILPKRPVINMEKVACNNWKKRLIYYQTLYSAIMLGCEKAKINLLRISYMSFLFGPSEYF